MKIRFIILLTLMPALAWAGPKSAADSAPSHERAVLQEIAGRLLKSGPASSALGDCLAVIDSFDTLAPAVIVQALGPVASRWWRRRAVITEPSGTALRAILREAARRAAQRPSGAIWSNRSAEVLAWSWLGPFDAGHGSAFDRNDPIESQVDTEGTYAGRDGAVRWQPVPASLVADPTGLRLDALVERPAEAILFGRSYIHLTRPTTLRVRLATQGPGRLMIDGVRVIDVPAPGRAADGRARLFLPRGAATVSLAAGWHQLRAKLGADAGHIWLGLELLDTRGQPLAHKASATPPASASSSVLPVVLKVERSTALSAIEAAEQGEAGDRIARLRAQLASHPTSTSLRVDLVAALDGMGRSAEAQRVWQLAPAGPPMEAVSIRACALRTGLWLRLGADLAGLQSARSCLKRWPRSPLAAAVAARLARARDNLAQAAQLQGLLVELEPGRALRHSQRVAALIQTGDLGRATARAEEMERILPGATRVAEMIASAAVDGRKRALARAWLDRVPAWRWRSSTWELSARLAAEMGQRERAIADLRAALRRAPSRGELRARLRLLEPAGDFYQAHRRDLVALARAGRGKPATTALARRLRQTVIRVLGGGRQARYEAEVVVIGKGGPGEHEVEIPYVPSQSGVEVLRAEVVRRDGRIDRRVRQDLEQLSEGWSGLYYDLEQIKLRFERLQPGDVVIVEAVTRDFVGDPFGFVFGELMPLAGHQPIAENEVVVELPAGTPLHHVIWDPTRGAPRADAMKRVVSGGKLGRSAGRWDVWRLRLKDMPAVAAEEDMPGATQVVPYLHMSSFASWTAAARWYAGLLRQALPKAGAEPHLTALARKLIAGQSDLAGRVNAIYRHVADRVRYVGLEFGIHSLQPHAPSLVLQRQFGDCKDKASLIVALLAEVGISAEVALVRTADNGRLGDGVASLGVFDHAIAYVPALGWWLDATLQGHAPTELPEGDAGGVALRVPVGVTSSVAEALPVAPARRNLRQESIEMKVTPGGDAQMSLTLRFTGLPAAEVRARLHSPATRKERLEADLTQRFAGLAIAHISVEGVDPVLPEVIVNVRGRVPHWARPSRGGLGVQPLRRQTPLVRALAPTSSRKHPLVSRWPGLSVQRMRIVAPPAMVVRRVPLAAEIPSPLGHFSLTVRRPTAGVVEIAKHFERRHWQVAAADYGAWKAWLARVDGALGGLVSLGVPEKAAP